MITSIRDYLKTLIVEELGKSNSKWKSDDYFYLIRSLSIDQRGRIGEHFLKGIFKELNKEIKYDENGHGDWDIEVDGIKIEVKLATLDGNNKFQHEGIKKSKLYDAVCFVDIAPNNLYITFIKKEDFEFNDKKGTFKLNGVIKNAHYRGKDNTSKRATGAGYKVDFSKKELIETKTLKDFENNFINTFLNEGNNK